LYLITKNFEAQLTGGY